MEGSWKRRLSRIIRPDPRQEVSEEMEFHLEQRVRDYVERGMDPDSAREAALARLGDLEGARRESEELLRAERRAEDRRRWVKVSWLDFKLGFRMLAKYPGLTIVGGLAMAFAIWVGAGTFEFVRQVVHPALPLHEGHRVVGIQLRDAQTTRAERRVAFELASWRGRLATVEHLGAFRTLERNLIRGDGVGEPVEVAEITASGFDVARVAPLLGRALVRADEAPGAPPVVVVGYDVWQRRFGGDPDLVGRAVRLGRTQATVVGVMPEGFEFPVAQSLWAPLRVAESDVEPRQGPGLRLFGRLAPGASIADARAELAALGRRAAIDHPETHEHLRPEVLPYPKSIIGIPRIASFALSSINVLVVLLLVLICGNVALLLFARAATRESELLVRSALGASRGRIIGQLFAEALVLGCLAAALGLAAAGFGLRWMYSTLVAELMGQRLPFWFHESLSPATIAYSLLLTLLAAAMAGVLPALKVSGKKVETRLREATAGGGGLKFGGVWTAVIVTQIALTMVVPVIGLAVWDERSQIQQLEVGFPDDEYLAVRLELDREQESGFGTPGWVDELASGPAAEGAGAVEASLTPFQARYGAAVRELEERLERDSRVAGVTLGERLPRMYHPHRLIEMDEGEKAPLRPEWPGYRVSSVPVALDYFDVLDVPILNGRGFHSGDLGADARTVVVNESFVENVLGGRNPLGRQFRYMFFENDEDLREPESEPWYQIVGVVPDLGLSWSDFDPKSAGIYHPMPLGSAYPIHMAIHVRGNPQSFTHELRTLATGVDPGLRLYDPRPLSDVDHSELRFYSFWFWIIVLVGSVALVLSLAGIYSVMSFAVSRRTREIGIRSALGADRGRIVAAIFRRPLIQVGLGLGSGGVALMLLLGLIGGGLTLGEIGYLALYMVSMALVCAIGCLVPTRRALTVEPTEALRAE